jgi:porphobilinogen synthase
MDIKATTRKILGELRDRPRRLRSRAWIRDLVAEGQLSPQDLVLPVFVCADGQPVEVSSMGIRRYHVEELGALSRQCLELGVRAVALFPVVSAEQRSEDARYAYTDELACQAITAIKSAAGAELGVITDVAIDRYTTHGQDGIVRDGVVINDESVEILAHMALAHAKAGADIVAPSDMLDGRVAVIRSVLDAAGHSGTAILSYTAKYASVQYGPFRDAVGSTAGFGAGLGAEGKKTYFMDVRNREEALKEARLDLEEGADILMVKPGLAFLDVIQSLARECQVPIAAYQVSGEYSMIRQSAAAGWCKYEDLLLETLVCLRRAGSKMIFTYGALEAAKILKGRG